MNCPVCNRGRLVTKVDPDDYMPPQTLTVSHLACVEHIAEDFDKLQREKKHAEAELAALRWQLNFIRTGRSARDVRDAEDAYRGLQEALRDARAEEGTSEDTYAGQCWGGADTPDERARAEEGGE